jgi:hypothetical protein
MSPDVAELVKLHGHAGFYSGRVGIAAQLAEGVPLRLIGMACPFALGEK